MTLQLKKIKTILSTERAVKALSEATYQNLQKAHKAIKTKNYKEAVWRISLASVEALTVQGIIYNQLYGQYLNKKEELISKCNYSKTIKENHLSKKDIN